MTLLLGVDGVATKTVALIADAGGHGARRRAQRLVGCPCGRGPGGGGGTASRRPCARPHRRRAWPRAPSGLAPSACAARTGRRTRSCMRSGLATRLGLPAYRSCSTTPWARCGRHAGRRRRVAGHRHRQRHRRTRPGRSHLVLAASAWNRPGAVGLGRSAYDLLLRGEYADAPIPAFQRGSARGARRRLGGGAGPRRDGSGRPGRAGPRAPRGRAAGGRARRRPAGARDRRGPAAMLAAYVRGAARRVGLAATGTTLVVTGGVLRHHCTDLLDEVARRCPASDCCAPGPWSPCTVRSWGPRMSPGCGSTRVRPPGDGTGWRVLRDALTPARSAPGFVTIPTCRRRPWTEAPRRGAHRPGHDARERSPRAPAPGPSVDRSDRPALGARGGVQASCRTRPGASCCARIAPGYPESGKWTLPGGGVDHGEHPDEGVVREVAEETGLVARVVSVASIQSGFIPRPCRARGRSTGSRSCITWTSTRASCARRSVVPRRSAPRIPG